MKVTKSEIIATVEKKSGDSKVFKIIRSYCVCEEGKYTHVMEAILSTGC